MPTDHQSQSLSSTASTGNIPPYWSPPQDTVDQGADSYYLPGLRLKPQQPPNGKCTVVEEAEQVRVKSYPTCNCACKEVKANGTIKQLIIDVPRGFRRVYIKLRRQRYMCKTCGMTVVQPLQCVVETRCLTQPGRQTPQGRKTKRLLITKRLLEYIQVESLLRPDLAVAKASGVSVRVVRAIRNAFTARLEKEVKFETPRVLGIDGVRIGGRFRINLTDIEAGLVVEVLVGAKKKLIRDWLKSLSDPDKIKIVLMDMCTTEYEAIKEVLPNCIIIIDRFHIQRMANQMMDAVRTRFYPRAKKERKPGEKRPRPEPFRMRRSRLEGRTKYLEAWFKVKPELGIAYNLKEDFLEIWDDDFTDVTSATGRSAAARKRYEQWEEKIPQEKEYEALRANCAKIKGAIKEWGTYVFNYFDYPFTNAFTESMNRQIKDNNRELRGCSFETARARIIYGTYLRKQREEGYQHDEAKLRPHLHKRRPQTVDEMIERVRQEALTRLEEVDENEPQGLVQTSFDFLN